MPGSLSVPPHLIQYIASPQTSQWHAAEALEEWIWQRRSKGDSLFEVSVGLLDLEDRAPYKSPAFDRARYVTNIPPPTALTPPEHPHRSGSSSIPLASSSPVTILHHLLSSPFPLERSREIILEYVLAREGRLRDKKSGRGGKGTLDKDGLEDVGARLGEVEDGLQPRGTNAEELDENRQMGLALILSLRMSLSYFTLAALGKQLMLLAIPDAERVLVQHVRRRVEGEGRYGVGKELRHLERLTISRPALRPAFRSAKAKTTLPNSPLFPIALPAPSKSACIKLITSFIRDAESGPSPKLRSYTLPSAPSTERSYLPRRSSISQNPGVGVPYAAQTLTADPTLDSSSIGAYVLELVSEYLTREKREYMLKCKWAVKGRDSLSKDLGDIETSTCLLKGTTASASAQYLIPVFLVLRRTYILPPSPLPPEVVQPYFDILPAPPEPDDEYRETSVSSTTASLYVNPRLKNEDAAVVLEELVESEREKVVAEGANEEEVATWINGLVEQVEKRFPDGSYAEVFARAKSNVPKSVPAPTSPANEADIDPQPVRRNSLHNRALSSYQTPSIDSNPSLEIPPVPERRNSHIRSFSLPTQQILGPLDSESGDTTPRLSQGGSELTPTPTPLHDGFTEPSWSSSSHARDQVETHAQPQSESESESQSQAQAQLLSPHDRDSAADTFAEAKFSLLALSSSSKPVLPAIQTDPEPFSFGGHPHFLSPADMSLDYASSNASGISADASASGDNRSSGGWWDVVSAVDSDTRPPWQRSNNSLNVAAATGGGGGSSDLSHGQGQGQGQVYGLDQRGGSMSRSISGLSQSEDVHSNSLSHPISRSDSNSLSLSHALSLPPGAAPPNPTEHAQAQVYTNRHDGVVSLNEQEEHEIHDGGDDHDDDGTSRRAKRVSADSASGIKGFSYMSLEVDAVDVSPVSALTSEAEVGMLMGEGGPLMVEQGGGSKSRTGSSATSPVAAHFRLPQSTPGTGYASRRDSYASNEIGNGNGDGIRSGSTFGLADIAGSGPSTPPIGYGYGPISPPGSMGNGTGAIDFSLPPAPISSTSPTLYKSNLNPEVKRTSLSYDLGSDDSESEYSHQAHDSSFSRRYDPNPEANLQGQIHVASQRQGTHTPSHSTGFASAIPISATAASASASPPYTPERTTSLSISPTRPRPPPIPLVFDRPNFPSPVSDRAGPPVASPPAATSALSGLNNAGSPNQNSTTGGGGSSTKSKLATFGRSMSMATKGRSKKDKDKEKDKEKGKDRDGPFSSAGSLAAIAAYGPSSPGGGTGGGMGGGGAMGPMAISNPVPNSNPNPNPIFTSTPPKGKENRRDRAQAQGQGPMNDPGRWNRDMVASIMGQPADRR